jgi:hypothetical protein
MKHFYVITGGTVVHVAPHLALSAPAYGTVGRQIYTELLRQCRTDNGENIHLMETQMAFSDNAPSSKVLRVYRQAGIREIETNDDLSKVLDVLCADPDTKGIFLAAAICDFKPEYSIPRRDPVDGVVRTAFGKDSPRYETSNGGITLFLTPADKLVGKIRAKRKDIFLVAFKTTAGATEDVQYAKGLHLLKGASANLVLANDVRSHVNMILTPEEARYHVTTDREVAVKNLVEMALLRSHLTFTRSTIVAGEPVSWDSPDVPANLRTVVNHCIEQGAYKPFRGATVGHFACKVDDRTFLTSRRKTNFNDLPKLGLVKIVTDGPDTVLAYGSRPSVGGQSQRIVFNDHPGMDCIVHFHCPLKPGSKVPVVSQREYECGSHECGKNTSKGLGEFTYGSHTFKAVFLEQHGPNIVFRRDTPPEAITAFIDENFDLHAKTGGIIPEV